MKQMLMRLMIIPLTLIAFLPFANAQMYGTGMWGGQQQCPYQQQIGDEAISIQDDINDRKELLAEAQAELREAKSEKRELERKMQTARNTIERRGIKAEYFAKIADHIEGKISCTDYKGHLIPGGRTIRGGGDFNVIRTQSSHFLDNDEPLRMPAQASTAPTEDNQGTALGLGNAQGDPYPWTDNEWSSVCDYPIPGRVLTGVCAVQSARVANATYSIELCKNNLKTYQETKSKLDAVSAKIDSLDAQVVTIKDEISMLRGTMKEAMREHQRDLREQMTEGGCVGCFLQGSGYVYQKPKTDWGGVITNLGLGLASMYFASDIQKNNSNNFARLGGDVSQMQTYPTWGYGFPFMMGALNAAIGGGGGIYGGISGGIGGGAFGCAGGYGGAGYGGQIGGAFGYPVGMYPSPYGGGMYSGYPNGMYGGIGGGFGMGFPGMGMGMPGMMGMGGPFGSVGGGFGGGFGMGFPGAGMGGMMGMGYPFGMGGMGGMGFPGMGGMGGMYPGMGSPFGMGGMGGIGMGFPGMGGMGGMYPGMGSPFGMGGMGGIGMGFPGMGGMMGMGYPFGMGGMGGIGMGFPGMGGMGGMGGYPFGMGGMGGMGGYGMDSGMMQLQMQMQQQQMQMQMQMYQQQMAMQQRAQESYYNRQRVVMGLQMELNSLLTRLQQAQQGAYMGGYLDFGGAGSIYGGGSTYMGSPTLPTSTPTNGGGGAPSSR